MSCNPDTVDVLVNINFRIRGDALLDLMANIEEDLPEGCFLHDLTDDLPKGATWSPDVEYPIEHPDWYGDGAGSSWDILIEKIFPRTRGQIDIIYCWEGGESYTGIRVIDGVVTEHEVIRSLGAEKTDAKVPT